MVLGSSNCSDSLAASAMALMVFLEGNRSRPKIQFPFAYSYPQNCCEGASRIFSYLIAEKYGLSSVVIKGTRPRKREHHFWVICEGLYYDLTAHQFPGRKPIIGVAKHSFFKSFPQQAISQDAEFVDQRKVLRLYRTGMIKF